jgi:hypothetical protein
MTMRTILMGERRRIARRGSRTEPWRTNFLKINSGCRGIELGWRAIFSRWRPILVGWSAAEPGWKDIEPGWRPILLQSGKRSQDEAPSGEDGATSYLDGGPSWFDGRASFFDGAPSGEDGAPSRCNFQKGSSTPSHPAECGAVRFRRAGARPRPSIRSPRKEPARMPALPAWGRWENRGAAGDIGNLPRFLQTRSGKAQRHPEQRQPDEVPAVSRDGLGGELLRFRGCSSLFRQSHGRRHFIIGQERRSTDDTIKPRNLLLTLRGNQHAAKPYAQAPENGQREGGEKPHLANL